MHLAISQGTSFGNFEIVHQSADAISDNGWCPQFMVSRPENRLPLSETVREILATPIMSGFPVVSGSVESNFLIDFTKYKMRHEPN